MLSNSTKLLRNDVRIPQRIEKGRLAVVDVAHDGDHGGSNHHLADIGMAASENLRHVALQFFIYCVDE